MKKIYMVVQGKDALGALEVLREFGEVHVEHQQTPFGQDLIILREDVKNIVRVLNALAEQKKKVPQEDLKGNWYGRVDDAIGAIDQIEQLDEIILKRKARIAYWEPWGNFDPKEIIRLREKGLFIKLCEINPKEKHQVPEQVYFEKIFTAGGIDRVMAFGDHDFGLPYDEVSLPSSGLKAMKEQQIEDQKKLSDYKKQLRELLRFKDSFKDILKSVEEELNFHEILEGMGKTDKLLYLKGFCPEDQVSGLEERAKKENWAIMVEEPSEDDHVPTLLKNPKWVELSKPAFDLIEVLPGYKEIDVSPVFLIFFTLFFAMLIGDAAYGAFFAGLVFLMHKKFGDKLSSQLPFYLGYLLTGLTVVWGLLTGTIMGQEWLPNSIEPVVPWLASQENIQLLCFTIALIHLNIAHIWGFVIKFPKTTAVSDLGWLCIVWGMYFLANMFVLDYAFPSFAKWFFIVGIPLAFFFMVPLNEFVKKVPEQIVPFILNVISSGTDLISYIRLFAVGLATVAVADAANSMPEALGIPGYFFLILLHTLNMILALMAILVHAIRLNVLEFSGHLGLEWVGVKYQPFKKALVKV